MSDFYCDEVLSGRLDVEVVAETADVLAFRHTRPSYDHHVVVIPKMHVPSLTDLGALDDSALLGLLSIVRQVARDMELADGACRVITNLGHYQETKHLHLHVVSGDRVVP